MRQFKQQLIASVLLLLGAIGLGAGQTYDPRTGIAEIPGSPLSPKSYVECDALQQQWSKLSQAIEDAHQKCLDAHHSEAVDTRASMSASNPVCSHPACQSLHTARIEYGKAGKSRVEACRSEVAQFQKRQQVERDQLQSQQRRQEEQSRALEKSLDDAMTDRKMTMAPTREQDHSQATKEKIAELLASNAQALQQVLSSAQTSDGSDASSVSGANEFARLLPDSSLPGSSNATSEVVLDMASPLVKKGNPPEELTQSWNAGNKWPQNGSVEKQVYIWQFPVEDKDLCFPVSDGQTITPRLALFQETAVVHYQVVDGIIVDSSINKRRGFLRCLWPTQVDAYPKYKIFPFYLKTKSAAIGDRG